MAAEPQGEPAGAAQWVREAESVDMAVYAAIAATPTPTLDRAMVRLTRAADYSKLNLGCALLLAATGGDAGRRSAQAGALAVAATSLVVNAFLKPLGRRRRPRRNAAGVPMARRVRMPSSSSLPSGHTAAAFAFATGAGHVLPKAAPWLLALATLVGYSRVHTGVHYPGDVVAGALVGTAVAQAAPRIANSASER